VDAYRVAIVVDRDYGSKLEALASSCHVWAVRSPQNEAATEVIWASEPEYSPDSGVSLFNAGADEEADLLSIIDVVEEHHGAYSQDPPVGTIEVIGTPPTPAAREVLADLGFRQLEATAAGFLAHRDRA
jgi:hypothetical protein